MRLLATVLSYRPQINLSMAAYPNLNHFEAMQTAVMSARDGCLVEPLWGKLSLAHIQVVPQSQGVFGVEEAQVMREAYPESRFRLHANVRVMRQRAIYDLSNVAEYAEHFGQAARVQAALGGEVYSAHAGYRANATMDQMFENARWVSDLFSQPVAIEGLYPDRGNTQLVSTWGEYRQVLDSGLPYALDLSHLNIVARRLHRREDTLVQELLASEQCLEIHVSDNDGLGDHHQVCDQDHAPWWLDLLRFCNPEAVIFTEGNQRRRRAGITGDKHAAR